MIQADFVRSKNHLIACSLRGHAGYDECGKDIVCASVTSAVQLTCNALTEVMQIPAEVTVLENQIKFELPRVCDAQAFVFMEALFLHLTILSEDYPGTIKVKVSEV